MINQSFYTLSLPEGSYERVIKGLTEYIENPNHYRALRRCSQFQPGMGYVDAHRYCRFHTEYASFPRLRAVRSALNLLKKAQQKGRYYKLAIPHSRERMVLDALRLAARTQTLCYGSYRASGAARIAVEKRIFQLRAHMRKPIPPLLLLAAVSN